MKDFVNPNPVSSLLASLCSLMPKPLYAQIFNKIWLNWNTWNCFLNLTIQKFSFQDKNFKLRNLNQPNTHENNTNIFYQWSRIKPLRENLFLRERDLLFLQVNTKKTNNTYQFPSRNLNPLLLFFLLDFHANFTAKNMPRFFMYGHNQNYALHLELCA